MDPDRGRLDRRGRPLQPRLPFAARVISVLGLLSVGFLLFTLLTSNPFVRLIPAPPGGADLNPYCRIRTRDPSADALRRLRRLFGRLRIRDRSDADRDFNQQYWTRPWTWAWLFLTVGIALGSWWAYYELGQGGWWFWDRSRTPRSCPGWWAPH